MISCIIITFCITTSTFLLSKFLRQRALIVEEEFYIAQIYEEKEKCRQQLGIFYHEPLSNKNKSKVQGKTARKTVANN